MNRVLVRNRIKCLFCLDIIESKFTHDFVTCKCGALSIDGGTAYAKRCYSPVRKAEECYLDLSEWRETK